MTISEALSFFIKTYGVESLCDLRRLKAFLADFNNQIESREKLLLQNAIPLRILEDMIRICNDREAQKRLAPKLRNRLVQEGSIIQDRAEHLLQELGVALSWEEIIFEKVPSQQAPQKSLPKNKTVLHVPTDCKTLYQAVRQVAVNGLVLLAPGTYPITRTLELNRNITVRGKTGNPNDVQIKCRLKNKPLLHVTQSTSQWESLSFHSFGDNSSAVEIEGGTPRWTHCRFTAKKRNGLRLTGSGTAPSFQDCEVMDCGGSGIFIDQKATGVFIDCNIHHNEKSGVMIQNASNTSFERCQIYENRETGVYVLNEGKGKFCHCEIHQHTAFSNVFIQTGGNPTFENCQIRDSSKYGIQLTNKGLGKFTHCRINGNTFSGVYSEKESNPIFRKCTIHDNKQAGFVSVAQGLGQIFECDIFANAFSGVEINGGNLKVVNTRIHEGLQCGIYVLNNGLGEISQCNIFQNAMSGIEIQTGGNPRVCQCKIYNGKAEGVQIQETGKGTFLSNEVRGHSQNWDIRCDPEELVLNENTGWDGSTSPIISTKPVKVYVPDQYSTLAQAMAAVPQGADIYLKPGKYTLRTPLKVHQNVRVCNMSERMEDVVLESRKPLLQITGGHPEFVGLTFRFLGSSSAIQISGGRPEFYSCQFLTTSGDGIKIQGKNTYPRLSQCWVTGGKVGIEITDDAGGLLKDCRVSQCNESGIFIHSNNTIHVNRCLVQDGKKRGIYAQGDGKFIFEENRVQNNGDNWDFSSATNVLFLKWNSGMSWMERIQSLSLFR